MSKQTLVIYYSQTGNVKKLSKSVVELLQADVEELIDKSKWTGVDGFFRRAGRAIQKGLTSIEPIKYNPKDYKNIVIISPLWSATIAPAIRTYLTENKENINSISLLVLGKWSDSTQSEKEVRYSLKINVENVLGILDDELKQDEYLNKIKLFTDKVVS